MRNFAGRRECNNGSDTRRHPVEILYRAVFEIFERRGRRSKIWLIKFPVSLDINEDRFRLIARGGRSSVKLDFACLARVEKRVVSTRFSPPGIGQ